MATPTGPSSETRMHLRTLTTLTCALSLLGCSDDSSSSGNTTGEPNSLVLGLAIGTSTYYGTTHLAKGSEDGANFYPHDAQSLPFVQGDHVYVIEAVDGTQSVTRYSLDASKAMENPQSLTFGGGSQPANLFFASDTKAYVSLSGAGKLAIIDPTTMKQTGAIDLSPYAAGGDGNPDPTSGIIRDGLLYVALSQRSSLYSAHDTAGCVAIVDVAKDSVIKIISDTRVNALGGLDDADRIVFMDENKDIYFYSNAVWGYQPGLKDGFLRIKNGTTEFDTSYSFSIMSTPVAGVAGNAATYGLVFAYAGNGIAYSMLQIPGLTSNPPDYVNDHNYQPVAVDLYNKTITALPIAPSPGYAAMGVVVENSQSVLFGLSIASGNGIYRYNPATNTFNNTPVLATSGIPMTFHKLEN